MSSGPPHGAIKVFVGSLPPDLTDAEFARLGEEAGESFENIVLRTSDGTTKGCGFMKFHNHEAALYAISVLDRKEVRGGMIEARLAHGESDALTLPARKIFVGSLPKTGFDEDQLLQVVERFGTVEEIVMFRTDTGESKGAAFVKFTTAEAAEAAIAGLDGTEHYPGSTQLLQARYAE